MQITAPCRMFATKRTVLDHCRATMLDLDFVRLLLDSGMLERRMFGCASCSCIGAELDSQMTSCKSLHQRL